MKTIENLRDWFYEKSVRNVDVDDNELLDIHSVILRKKPLLRSAFETFYLDMISYCDQLLKSPGTEIELGSGAGFFKSVRPGLISSDIRKGPNFDMILDAQNMALQDNSVRCIYSINVFHHLPDPESFFTELCRVLQPGGGCILIEPHAGFSSALLHRYSHSDEKFFPKAKSWQTTDIAGPLSGANQAMAYIVFERDIERFNSLFGEQLEIVYKGYVLNGLRYLFSGGLNFRQLLPTVFEPFLRILEALGKPLARYWSLHQVIVIRKCK